MGGVLRIAVGQWSPIVGQIGPNIDRLSGCVSDAVSAGGQFLVTPELGLTGYLLRDITPEIALPSDAPQLNAVAELSYQIPLVAGFVEKGEDGQCYNSAGCWAGGDLLHIHRKIYLPTYGLFDEGRFFARGDRVETFSSPVGRIALLVCEDIWHPSASMLAVLQGAVGLVIISAAPGRGISYGRKELSSRRTWINLITTFSRLLGCWVAWSNRTGFEDGIFFPGGSMVLSPVKETPLVEAGIFESGTWVVDLDMTPVERDRALTGVLREEDIELTHRQLGQILEGRLQGGGSIR